VQKRTRFRQQSSEKNYDSQEEDDNDDIESDEYD